MSWIKDVWDLVQAVATLTREVERATGEVKELRTDVNRLALIVSQLKADAQHQKERTELVLDNYENNMAHTNESLVSKFDVLTVRLDQKIADFETRLTHEPPRARKRRALGTGNAKPNE